MIKKIVTYAPVVAFLSLMVFDFYQVYFVSKAPCECVVQYTDSFMMNEILFLIMSLFLFATSKNYRLCYYNKLASAGLIITSLLNIIAISTPFDFSIYNSIITQIFFTSITLVIVYLVIKRQ